MKRFRSTPSRAVLLLAAILPLLGGCWWLEPEPEPGEWSLRSGRIADFRPYHKASLFESGGDGQLLMECTVGAIELWIASGRDWGGGDADGVTATYRLDGNAPVAVMAGSDQARLWFRDPETATGENPMVRQIEEARQLTVRIDWSESDRQLMRFDVSRAGPAIAWLRRECAEAGRRMGATS